MACHEPYTYETVSLTKNDGLQPAHLELADSDRDHRRLLLQSVAHLLANAHIVVAERMSRLHRQAGCTFLSAVRNVVRHGLDVNFSFCNARVGLGVHVDVHDVFCQLPVARLIPQITNDKDKVETGQNRGQEVDVVCGAQLVLVATTWW